MDFDDAIKVLIPKSKRKKLKRRFKKKGLAGIFQPLILAF